MSQTFTVANFNLRNLVPASNAEHRHFFYGPGKHNYYNQADFNKKTAWIGGQLDQLNADIVAFEEVFEVGALASCLDQSELMRDAQIAMPQAAQNHITNSDGKPSTIYQAPQLALAYRGGFELLETKSHVEFPSDFNFDQAVSTRSGQQWALSLNNQDKRFDTFSRPVLQARFALPSSMQKNDFEAVTIFVAHLKSKRPIIGEDDNITELYQMVSDDAVGQARSLIVRALEAAALRRIVAQYMSENPDQPVMLLGDLNDGPHSVSTQIGGGVRVPRIHPSHEADYDRRKALRRKMGDLRLYSGFDLQTQRTHRDVYYTHIFDGHFDLLDNIFVSNHFVPEVARGDNEGHNKTVAKIGTLRVFNDHILNADIDDMRASSVGQYLHTRSDHGQISLRIDLD